MTPGKLGRSTCRVALISDIHGNDIALEGIQAHLKGAGIDGIVCLGDVALGGPHPAETVERIAQLNCAVVRGNTEEWLLNPERPDGCGTSSLDGDMRGRFRDIEVWGAQQLRHHHRQELETYRQTVSLPLDERYRLLAYHGSPRSAGEPVLPTTPEAELTEMFGETTASVLAGGHTHLQMLRRHREALVINPGSVGLPRGYAPPAFAEYAIVRVEGLSLGVELKRVPIDNERVARAVLASTMPHREWLASQWRRGQAP